LFSCDLFFWKKKGNMFKLTVSSSIIKLEKKSDNKGPGETPSSSPDKTKAKNQIKKIKKTDR
jgi:hypothetical protein